MNPYQSAGTAYQAQAVETAGPVQLVIMLYDGAVAAIARSEYALTGSDGDRFEVVNKELTRAQDIVTELWLSLDYELGGVIAGNLASIYQHCLAVLTRANLDKSARELPEVKEHLIKLREAFASAAAQVAVGAA